MVLIRQPEIMFMISTTASWRKTPGSPCAWRLRRRTPTARWLSGSSRFILTAPGPLTRMISRFGISLVIILKHGRANISSTSARTGSTITVRTMFWSMHPMRAAGWVDASCTPIWRKRCERRAGIRAGMSVRQVPLPSPPRSSASSPPASTMPATSLRL